MSRSRAFSWCALGVVVWIGTAAAQPPSANWPAVSARLEPAATTASAAELRALRTELIGLVSPSLPDEQRALVQYAIAYVASRMANVPGVPGAEADRLLEDAVERLRAVVKSRPRDAEAHALLGSVYGLQIARSPLKGMLLGPRASGALDKAAELAPDNPRVVLQQGISAFNTPALFGGGTEKGERLLRRSLTLFAREPADRPWPNWGRFDTHVWLGQALRAKGDRAGARVEYDRALALAPGSGWVRYVLLPALEAAKP
jgi:hypothetical protein